MTDLSELKTYLERVGDGFDAFKNSNDDRLDLLLERIEDIEAKASQPSRSLAAHETKAQIEHRDLFTKWLRNPNDAHVKNLLGEFEAKAVSIGPTLAAASPSPSRSPATSNATS